MDNHDSCMAACQTGWVLPGSGWRDSIPGGCGRLTQASGVTHGAGSNVKGGLANYVVGAPGKRGEGNHHRPKPPQEFPVPGAIRRKQVLSVCTGPQAGSARGSSHQNRWIGEGVLVRDG